MSQFFQSLLDLGEQKPKAVTASGRDLESLSPSELVSLCTSLQQQLAAKNTEFDQLQSEAMALRKEYDGFRRKAEDWQAQMKVTRDNDRRLIEQLRSAGQGGEDTEAVMSQALQETVTKLKEELRAVQEERGREARRRTEAELAAQRMEAENKREVATLKENFESLKGKMREQQASSAATEHAHSQQIRELQRKLAVAKEELAAAESRRPVGHAGEAGTAGAGGGSPAAAAASGDGAGSASAPKDESADATSSATAHPATAPVTAASDDHAERSRRLQERVTALEGELQSSEDGGAAARRRVQQLELDKQDLDNTAARMRVEVEQLQLRCAALNAQLEEKDETASTAKRQWQQQVQSLEHAVEEERGLRAKAGTRADAQLEQLRAELHEARQRSADKDQAVSEAALRSRAAVAEGETQRQQLEAALLALEAKLQEAHSRRVAVDATLAEAHAEIRRRNALVDEVRQEHERTQQRLEEAESQVVVLQRSTAAREREALSRDRMLHDTEAELENERRECQRLRQQNAEMTETLAAAQVRVAQLQKQHQLQQQQQQYASRNNSDASIASISPLGGEKHHNADRNSPTNVGDPLLRSPSPPNAGGEGGGGDSDAERWASATREWLARLEHERRVAAEAVRVREEQSAKMRHLESKVDELTFKLSAAESSAAASALSAANAPSSSSPSSFHVSMPHTTASSVLLSHGQAWHQQVMSTVQRHTGGWLANRRGWFILAIVFFAVVVVFNFSAAASVSGSKELKDYETITSLKEKYAHCLDVVATKCKLPSIADSSSKLVSPIQALR